MYFINISWFSPRLIRVVINPICEVRGSNHHASILVGRCYVFRMLENKIIDVRKQIQLTVETAI